MALEKLYERRGEGAPACSILFPVWNGTKFIRESLPAALAQEGVRAEVLISDDSSTDGSLKLLLEIAKAYQGPHDVVVYRGTKRLELAHMPSLAAEARSEVLIQAHQDDFSKPHRARVLREAMRSGVYLASSAASWRRGDGGAIPTREEMAEKAAAFETAEPFLYSGHGVLIGARYAMHADLFRLFPRLEPAYLTGGVDIILAIRAAMLGDIAILKEKLLTCTMHKQRWSFQIYARGDERAQEFSHALRRLAVLERAFQELADARSRGLLGPERHDRLHGWMQKARRHFRKTAVQVHEALLRDGFKLTWKPPGEGGG